MKITHHGIEEELLDSWWGEANMEGFSPCSRAFQVDMYGLATTDVFEVNIFQIGPLIRASGIGIFNSNFEATAQERVVRILRAIKSNTPLPPVQLVEENTSSEFCYKLTAGYHRLFCSIACGFTHVPVIEGYVHR